MNDARASLYARPEVDPKLAARVVRALRSLVPRRRRFEARPPGAVSLRTAAEVLGLPLEELRSLIRIGGILVIWIGRRQLVPWCEIQRELADARGLS